jgi:acyl-coenzyme A thioesterase PaaI-like protein
VTIQDRASISTINDHDWCLLCGEKNPWSLNLSFHADNGGVMTKFQTRQALQGYKGIIHGGVISALLDAAMTHCLFHQGIRAVTGDLRVRFLKPVSCHGVLNLRAWILSATPPLYRLKAELSTGEQIMAWAKATFMQQKNP